RAGLVADVTAPIAAAKISMSSVRADSLVDGQAQIQITVGEVTPWRLRELTMKVGRVDGVRRVAAVAPEIPTEYATRSVVAHEIENPHTLKPVTGRGFFGRRSDLRVLVDHLRQAHPGEAVLLWGPRRI